VVFREGKKRANDVLQRGPILETASRFLMGVQYYQAEYGEQDEGPRDRKFVHEVENWEALGFEEKGPHALARGGGEEQNFKPLERSKSPTASFVVGS